MSTRPLSGQGWWGGELRRASARRAALAVFQETWVPYRHKIHISPLSLSDTDTEEI
jgi:hypothetical protein